MRQNNPWTWLIFQTTWRIDRLRSLVKIQMALTRDSGHACGTNTKQSEPENQTWRG